MISPAAEQTFDDYAGSGCNGSVSVMLGPVPRYCGASGRNRLTAVTRLSRCRPATHVEYLIEVMYPLTSDIRQWLDSLNPGQYGDAFEDNAIDWYLLPDLTEELLERLGITALGHRMRILRAIAAFNDEQTVASPLSARPDIE